MNKALSARSLPLRWRSLLGVGIALGLMFSAPLRAERTLLMETAQEISYSVNVTQSIVELTLMSRGDLPEIRPELLGNGEGFYLRLSRPVNLDLLSLAQSAPLIVIPTQDGMSVLVLVPGVNTVRTVGLGKTKVSIEIVSDPVELQRYFARKSRPLGRGDRTGSLARQGLSAADLAEAAVSTSGNGGGNLEERAVLQTGSQPSTLASNQYVTLRGRVITSNRLGELMQLPNVRPQFPLSTYLNAAINPPGTDTVYLPGTTLTGGTGDHDPFLGYKVGPGSFRPFVMFMYEHDSNLLGSSVNRVSSDSYVLSPILEYEILGKTRDLRIAYNPVFRWITNFNQGAHIEHFLNFDSRVEISDHLRVALRDHFARGVYTPQEFDPGRELSFSSEPYFRNDVGAEFSLDVSDKDRLIGDVDYNRLWFDRRLNDTFFNYDSYSFSAGWLRDQWATANFFLRYRYTRTLTSGINASGRNGTANDYDFGINKAFTDRTTGNFTLGYRDTSFDNSGLANFHSWTARASLTKELNDRNTFDIAAIRTSSLSAFGTGQYANSYFVNDGINAQFRRLGEHVQLTLGGGYQRNQYPEDSVVISPVLGAPAPGSLVVIGPRRHDSLWNAGADVGWVLNDKMIVDFGYNFEKRQSNLGPLFSYNRHIFRVSFNLGRASSGEGQQVYSRSGTFDAQP